jgi:ribulose-5-phosphate 4-epimerase/fuculose-1-phosphate aldolase
VISPENERRISELVDANRILADQAVLDGFGHVSVCCDANPQHFYQARSQAPALVTADDIREFDENSELVVPTGEPLYGERYIHRQIYRIRPDVQAVVHSHSFGVIPFVVIPFGVSGVPLRPLCHQAAFLPGAIPVFEIRDTAGEDNAMLVTSNLLGAGVASALGSCPVVLMRGHGDTVVGSSLKQVVYRAIYTEINARLVLESLRLGPTLNYVNEFELANMGAIADRTVDRPWEIWRSRILT